MMMQVGRGLKSVAKKEFDAKVRRLANPVLKTASYKIVAGKVQGVPVHILSDAVITAGHHFNQTADTFYVARR